MRTRRMVHRLVRTYAPIFKHSTESDLQTYWTGIHMVLPRDEASVVSQLAVREIIRRKRKLDINAEWV